jgi:hypothetical protein
MRPTVFIFLVATPAPPNHPGYAAWHVFILVLAVAVGRLQGNWKMIFWRLLKLPYLWSPGGIFGDKTELVVGLGLVGTTWDTFFVRSYGWSGGPLKAGDLGVTW